MNTSISKIFLAIVLSFCSVVSSAWAERILISDAEQTVILSEPFDCYSAAQITLKTSRPEIYEQAGDQLQAVVDTARAMLAFECSNLSEIRVKGQIRGLDGLVYEGISTARNHWQIQSTQRNASNGISDKAWSNEQANSDSWIDSRNKLVNNHGSLSLTDIRLGMTVEEVKQIVLSNFNVEPFYEKETGVLYMRSGGCPQDFNADIDYLSARAGWKCLSAQFSDNRVARLETLELMQVSLSNSRLVQDALVGKYGQPIEQKTEYSNNASHLTWRILDQTQGESEQIQELNARLLEIESDRVMTSLTLSNTPAINDNGLGYADIGIKL